MDKFINTVAQKKLFELREKLYKAYDDGNENMVYRLSRNIDQLQILECICVLPEANVG